jgi:hypothetical protein
MCCLCVSSHCYHFNSPINILCFLSAVIEANVNCPEANREVTLYQVINIVGVVKTEERYHGYSIHLPIDMRWTLDDDTVDHYSARVWKDDSILIRIPAMEYTVLHNREEFNASVTKENVVDAVDHSRHEFVNNKDNREWQYLLLQFPAGHVLSSKVIFEDAGDSEELDYDLVDVAIKHKDLAAGQTKHWVHFQVARTDLRVSKRGKVEHKEKKSKMAAKMEQKRQGMKTSP